MGGGDGGVLREVARHLSIEEIHLAEIDECANFCLSMQQCKAVQMSAQMGCDQAGADTGMAVISASFAQERLWTPTIIGCCMGQATDMKTHVSGAGWCQRLPKSSSQKWRWASVIRA